MSVVNNNLLLAAAEDAGPSYVIDRSLRFRRSASAFLNRTPASAGNRKTWTWSAWVKRGQLGGALSLFGCQAGAGNPRDSMQFDTDKFTYDANTTGSSWNVQVETTQVSRDASAWYHIIVVADTTQATASNRIKIYVNGSQVTSLSLDNYPSQNTDLPTNQAQIHYLGAATGGNYFDGYLTEINFIDGQALDPDSFGEYNESTGVWQPKEYEGTYGTNGFYLNFGDPTTLTTLTADQSGNGNNWTANNISLTSGATFDSMIDTPTPVTDERGNFCVLNPLDNNGTLSNGNLQVITSSSTSALTKGTFAIPESGKWYFEVTASSGANIGYVYVGSGEANVADSVLYAGFSGQKRIDGTFSSYGTAWSNGDVIGVAVNVDDSEINFYRNGVDQGAISFTFIGKTMFPAIGDSNVGLTFTAICNFGQRPFEYTPPSGFKTLHTGNLPEPAIVDGGEYFNTVTWTGDGDNGRNITSLSFKPDFVWLKNRSTSVSHILHDAVRGIGDNALRTDANSAESGQFVNSFNSDGFNVNNNIACNATNNAYVAWNWKANGAGVSNTAGSITSTVSAGVTQGFSVVTYTGNGTNGATVGHGLGVAPSMVIVKGRNTSLDWVAWHSAIGTTSYLILNKTNAVSSPDSSIFNGLFSSSVFRVGNWSGINGNTNTYVAYCFAEVPGYSRFGSYTGNGSADGPFIFTGFRPAFVMVKRTDVSNNWVMLDSERDVYNVANSSLLADRELAETDYGIDFDILSNGFKLRSGTNPENASGGTYIYMTFAEIDFANALAR